MKRIVSTIGALAAVALSFHTACAAQSALLWGEYVGGALFAIGAGLAGLSAYGFHLKAAGQ